MAQVTVTTVDDTNDAGIKEGSLFTIDWLATNPKREEKDRHNP
jgi:hypothetical protein